MTRRVLIVEDSDEDFQAILRALGKKLPNELITRCLDGDDALDMLRARKALARSDQLPDMIVLDLNLPGTDGREILTELKADAILGIIPIIILSTSNDPKDIRECYRRGAAAYCVKPIDRQAFDETINAIKRFWFHAVALPEAALPS